MDLSSLEWRKSARSTAMGPNCVEVATNLVGACWNKSSRSGNTTDNCVEVANLVPEQGFVAVRDSKNPTGPALTFTPEAWADFAAATSGGQFNLA
jgi:Domain of unknown function (DUF397)